MKTLRYVGSTDVSDVIVIRNKADNTPVTGIVFGDVTAYYHRIGSVPVQVPLQTQTVTGSHAVGGFVEIDAVNVPGHYRIDHPDGMFTTGVDSVFFQLKGHTDMNPVDVEIELTTFEVSDPTSTKRLVNIDEATSPSEISDYIDANSTLASETTAVKAVTDVIPDSGALTSIAQEATLGLIAGATFNTATDSMEAIRDRGDSAWITGGGGAAPTVEEIRIEMDANSTQLASIVADLLTVPTDVWDNVVENGKTAKAHLNRIKAILGGNTNTNGTVFLADDGVTTETTVAVDTNSNRTFS